MCDCKFILPWGTFIHQLPESPKAPHRGVSRVSHEKNFLMQDVHNICTGAEKHEAKEREKYNKTSFIHYGFSWVTRYNVGIIKKKFKKNQKKRERKIRVSRLRVRHLNCGLRSPIVPLFSPFPLHSLCPALFFLHSRAEAMGTSRATSSLTVMLNSCLDLVVPCDWGHKKRSWKQVIGD